VEQVEPGGGKWAVRPRWPTTPSPADALARCRPQVGTVNLAQVRSNGMANTVDGRFVSFVDISGPGCGLVS